MSTAISITTAEALWEANPKERCELVRGELRMMSPAGGEHGWIIVNISTPLATFVTENKLGYAFGAETEFIISRDPDSVRAPDVSFVRQERIEGPIPKKFFPGPPDLAVEVLSPSDSKSEVEEKTEDWLASGCLEVWLVDPADKSATKCTLSAGGVVREQVEILTSDLLLGFELHVAGLFQ